MTNDNISAISTSLGASGVAVIRISGSTPLKVAEKMFFPVGKVKVLDFEPNKMYVGEIDCGGFKDFGMCVYFKAPKSFTGEDTVEFHSHGGVAITRGILKTTLKNGARLATNGEFTKRAFMNGKLSLSSCEGLIDMINGETEAQAKAGYSLYRERLNKKVNEMQDLLTDALCEIDADMDFPEEDLELDSHDKVKEILAKVVFDLKELISTYRAGRNVMNGVKVGIVGKPNTGKSSLLNALLSYEKAIVSDIPGTTRDIVEGSLDIKGVRFNFFDTAGIRESEDKIEEIGVSMSKKVLLDSDLIIFVLDGTACDKDDEIYSLVKDKNLITVLNKSDLGDFNDERADIKISAKENLNIDLLRDMMYDKTVGNGIDLNGDFICEERHFEALTRAKDKLEVALSNTELVTLDLLSIDIKEGWDALGEISGKTATEEIINGIFSKFCVGK